MADTTPYSTTTAFTGALPTWLNKYDAERLNAYKLYEDIYWGNPDAFKLVQRGSESKPIYVPSGKVICNTMNRYTGKNWRPSLVPVAGNEQAELEAMPVLENFYKREAFRATYAAAKRWGIIRGDWCFQITANPDKPAGRRLSIKAIDPGMYFPLEDPNDVDRILGVDIVEQLVFADKAAIKRTRYLKSEHPDRGEAPGGPITYQVDIMEQEGWETDKPKFLPSPNSIPATPLPSQITAIPVYHIKNKPTPGDPYGSSEMRGLERLMAAINQSITDEDLALALAGIGVYVTDAGSPRNLAGEVVPWALHPGAVIEVGGGKEFARVTGVGSVTPYQDHLAYLHDQVGRATGASDVAQGVVDVTVAESGIALELRMAPILSEAAEAELNIAATLDQMQFDLLGWFQAYEGIDMTGIVLESTFDSGLPEDKKARLDRALELYNAIPPLVTAEYVRDEARACGLPVPLDMQASLDAEADANAARLDAEAAAGGGVDDGFAQDELPLDEGAEF